MCELAANTLVMAHFQTRGDVAGACIQGSITGLRTRRATVDINRPSRVPTAAPHKYAPG